MAELPIVFTELLQNATLEQKHAMLKALSEDLSSMEMKTPPPKCSTPTLDARSLVEHVSNLNIDDSLNSDIQEELHSLNLKKPGRGIKTKWLVPTNDLSNFNEILNNPLPIDEYPNISKLMKIVNDHSSSTGDMNSCLVTRYPSDRATLSLHCDNETYISQCSSICTVSLGAPRELEIVLNGKPMRKGKTDVTPDLVLPATDRTMNVMKPGAQSKMKHAVGANNQGKLEESSQVRFSLSFRKIIPLNPDYSLRPTPASATHTDKKSIVLIAGDSFAARLKADLLGKGKTEVRNIAIGGRKINQVQQDIEEFLSTNSDINVSKLFISIGANDIRYCEKGVHHLKSSLSTLMRTIRSKLPATKIWIQSIPPINPNGSKFLATNVIKMNALIYNMCSRYKIFYLNIFCAFLDRYGRLNSKLFMGYDPIKKHFDIHPNRKGMGVLARFYIFIIHSKWFNPQGY